MNWKVTLSIILAIIAGYVVYSTVAEAPVEGDIAIADEELLQNESEAGAMKSVDATDNGDSEATSAVATESSQPTSIPSQTVSSEQTTANTTVQAKDENGYWVVTYTDSGFWPYLLEVKQRETVKFVNKSSRPMMIESFDDTSETGERAYPGLKQPYSLSQDGVFVFTFIKTGVWGYQNVNKESHRGAVVVMEDEL